MKQLTMTKVLTPLAALAFAFGVQAAVPSFDGFEDYTAGTTVITNQTGWSFTYGADGADDASAITAYDNNAPGNNILPDGTTAGSNYLKLSTEDGMLFRNMDGASGATVDLNQGLFVDTDVQFTITDPSDRPEVTNDDKFIVWLEADGSATNLCVWAREFTVSGDDVSVTSNKVYKLVATGANPVDIAVGSWHRLTVKAIQAVGSTYTFPAFQVFVDGVQFRADTEYIVDSAGEVAFKAKVGESVVNDQLYFPAMANTMESLSKVGFSGEGAIDNVVVTKNVPAFEEPTTITFNFDTSVISSVDIDDLGISLTSSGSTVSAYPGQTFDLTLNFINDDEDSYTITAESNSENATIANMAVTTVGFGAATITINTTAKDTVNVTFNWGALDTAMGARNGELTNITFTYGETTVSAATEIGRGRTSKTIDNLKVGTNITVAVTFSVADAWVYTITPPATMSLSGDVLTINQRGDGTATVMISGQSAPPVATVNGQSYTSFAAALAAATAGQTITLQADVESAATLSTAAATIDLNGYSLGSATTITFTGSGAATLKGGEITNCYDTLTINSPAGQNLTIEGMTFHCSVKPQTASDASLLLVTNCQFLCDIAKDGTTDAGKNYHSYGVQLISKFARADVVDNAFKHPRRTAIQVNGLSGDAYIYGNSFDATRLTTYTTEDGNELFPEMQIFKENRIFIENNTFTGQYMTGAFGLYNKKTDKSTDAALVFNGNTVDATVPYLWTYYVDIASGGATNVTGDLVMPNVFFGANNIGAGVDTTQGRYKELVQPVPVAYAETLALPTGVATVYEWTHGANAATPYYVTLSGTPSYAANLSEVEAGDTVIAVPGAAAPVDTAELEFTVDSTYKNKWTAAAPQASGWVDDSSTIVADTTAGAQYSDLADTALADADAKELTDWAKTNSIDYSAVVAAPGDFVDAFLLNCAVADVATEKAAFKAKITVAADGTVTVTLDDTTKTYNGTLQLKGKANLTDAEWTDVAAPSSSYKFYKYTLSL